MAASAPIRSTPGRLCRPALPRPAAVGRCARIQPAARRAARRAERRVAARARDPRRVAFRSAVWKRVVRGRLGQRATAMDQRPVAVGGRRRSGTTGEPVGRRKIRHHVRRCRRPRRPLHPTGDRPLAGRRAPRPGAPRLALGSAQRTRSARWLTAASGPGASGSNRDLAQHLCIVTVLRVGVSSAVSPSRRAAGGHRRAVPVFEGTSFEPISRKALTFVTPACTSPVIQGCGNALPSRRGA